MFWRFVLPIALVAACLVFGTVGFLGSDPPGCGKTAHLTIAEAFWFATGLPILQTTTVPEPGSHVSPWLQIGRILGLLVPPYAFVILLTSVIGDRVKMVKIWWWRHVSRRPYVVVLGLGWIGNELVQDLTRSGDCNVVALDKLPTNPFRSSLHRRRSVFVNADATSSEALRRIGVAHAHKLYIVCDSDETNCLIIDQVASLRNPQRGTLADRPSCYVHILDSRKRLHLSRMRESIEALNITCFNTYDTTARRLYFKFPNYRFADNGDSNRPSAQTARVVILGYTPMGRAILLRCLQSGHFRAHQRQEIVILATNAKSAEADFLAEYPCFDPAHVRSNPTLERVVRYAFQMMDGLSPVRFVEMPRSDGVLLSAGFVLNQGLTNDDVLSLYACMDDGLGSAGYVAPVAERLHGHLSEPDAGRTTDPAIYLYYNIPLEQQRSRLAFVARVLSTGQGRIRLQPFGNLMEECSAEVVEATALDARARALAGLFAGATPAAPNEDDVWTRLPEGQRESNRQAADHIRVKLRCFGIDAQTVRQNPGNEILTMHEEELAEMEHRRWCAEKLLDGWTPLPPTPDNLTAWKDATAGNLKKRQKLHLSLVPFDDLAENDKLKNRAQIRDITACLSACEDALDEEDRNWGRNWGAPAGG